MVTDVTMAMMHMMVKIVMMRALKAMAMVVDVREPRGGWMHVRAPIFSTEGPEQTTNNKNNPGHSEINKNIKVCFL